MTIARTDSGTLISCGRRGGRCNWLSTKIAAKTNNVVNTPNITIPIGVRSVRVFLVPVAAL